MSLSSATWGKSQLTGDYGHPPSERSTAFDCACECYTKGRKLVASTQPQSQGIEVISPFTNDIMEAPQGEGYHFRIWLSGYHQSQEATQQLKSAQPDVNCAVGDNVTFQTVCHKSYIAAREVFTLGHMSKW